MADELTVTIARVLSEHIDTGCTDDACTGDITEAGFATHLAEAVRAALGETTRFREEAEALRAAVQTLPGYTKPEYLRGAILELMAERDAAVRDLAALRAALDAGEASDGYHTHRELYDYRMLYNAHAAHGWVAAGIPVVKSRRHSDGEPCFGGGWFIVTATLPTGQVSNHYRDEHWDLFTVPEVRLPPEYDGHTPADAADRLRAHLADPTPSGEVGTGAGEADDPATTEATSGVTRSVDWPEAPAQAHLPATDEDRHGRWVKEHERYEDGCRFDLPHDLHFGGTR